MDKKTLQSQFGLRGKMVAKLYGPTGELKGVRTVLLDRREVPNTVTTAGDKWVAEQLTTHSLAQMSHMAIGTGSGQTANDNSLANELDRNALDTGYPQQGTGANDNDVIYKATWSAGDGTGAITEAGIFNNATPGSGQMLCYASFDTINKGANDTLEITWTFTCGSS